MTQIKKFSGSATDKAYKVVKQASTCRITDVVGDAGRITWGCSQCANVSDAATQKAAADGVNNKTDYCVFDLRALLCNYVFQDNENVQYNFHV